MANQQGAAKINTTENKPAVNPAVKTENIPTKPANPGAQQQNKNLNPGNKPNQQQNGGANQNRNNNQNNNVQKNNNQQQNKNQQNQNKFNQNKNDQNKQNPRFQNGQQHHNQNGQDKSRDMNLQPQPEKKFTGRCRLFVGNLPSDITEAEFKELFTKFGETGEVFLNSQRSFGFIKLDTRINAEHAKQELDGFTFKGRCIRVRFASHGAAVRVKNLSPYVSNEYLEQAFAMFGPVERAVVIVDDKGRPTGEGIVEFERKPAASQCLNRCTEGCFVLTSYPKPVIVEPLEQKDDEDGLSEKSIIKNNQYHTEREEKPHFAQNGSFEFELALKWRELYELEKQINEEGKKRIDQARELLEYEIEQRLIDHKTQKIKEDLQRKQEELIRIEEMRKTEFQRRKDMEIRRQEDERRRQEEMMLFRKQQETILMHQQSNARGNQSNGQNQQQNQFDQGLLNQPHMPPVMSGSGQQQQQQQQRGGGGGGNQRYDQNGQYGQQGGMGGQMQPQQAMLAAQLAQFAMAANLNMPMYDQQQQQQAMGGGGIGGQNQNQKGGRDGDFRNGDRRNFNRRGGGANNNGPQARTAGNREDSSPFPGYDTKRARY